MNRALNLKRIALGMVVSVMSLMPATTYADDTDVYLASVSDTTSTAASQPNVLLILDTSGSMSSGVDGDSRDRLEVMQDVLHEILDQAQSVNMGMMRFSYEGGPVLYPVADLNANAQEVENPGSTTDTSTDPVEQTVTRSVQSSSDDAHQVGTTTSGDLFVTDAEIPLTATSSVSTVRKSITVLTNDTTDDGYETLSSGVNNLSDGNIRIPFTIHQNRRTSAASVISTERVAGFRFDQVPIPAGATVETATITLQTSGRGQKSTVRYDITVEDTDEPNFFDGSNDDISSRDTSGSPVVTWAHNGKQSGRTVTTGNLKNLMQHLVDKPGWESGDYVNFFFSASNYFNANLGYRQYYSRNNSQSRAPKLNVTYVASEDAGVVDHSVGMRFQDMRVPQGARIKQAYINFTSASSSDDDFTVAIRGQKSDGAIDTFSAGNDVNNTGQRPRTSGIVKWTEDASTPWNLDEVYPSDDITSLVQEIVDQSDWCGGDDMAFFLEGSGGRRIHSYDGDSSKAPELVITFEDDFSTGDTGCTTLEYSYQVSGSSNDAYTYYNRGNRMSTNDTELYLGNLLSGVRFENVDIENSDEINAASLEFITNDSGSMQTVIRGHDVASSSSFSSSNRNDLYNRDRYEATGATVNWNASAGSSNTRIVSPDLSNIVTEIKNRSDWESENDLAFLLDYSSGDLRVKTYDNQPSSSARLNISLTRYLAKASGAGLTVREKLKEIVDTLPHSGGTPATDTLYEAALYLTGQQVNFGYTRTPTRFRNTSYDRYYSYFAGFRTSHPATYRPIDATVFNNASCPGRDSSNSACSFEHISASPLPTYSSPIISSCQTNHVILLSDGEPNGMVGEDLIAKMTGTNCDDDTACASALADYLSTEDLDLTDSIAGEQTATVHTIGFGLSSSYLKAVADAGGGGYYEADEYATLLNAFQSIIQNAVDTPQTFVAPTLAVNAYSQLTDINGVYYSLFIPDSSRSWQGNLKRYEIGVVNTGGTDSFALVDQNGDIAVDPNTGEFLEGTRSFWSKTEDGNDILMGGVGSLIPEYDSRKLYTYVGSNPDDVDLTQTSQIFDAANSSVTGSSQWPSSLSSTELKELIQWTMGKNVDGVDPQVDGSSNRWSFGDPLHSQAVTITYGPGSDLESPEDDEVYILVATNAGVLHFINADEASGVEQWAFIPEEMYEIQEDLRTDATGAHIYGIDGSPVVVTIDENNDGTINASDGDAVYAYVTARRGGNFMYAFDITTPDKPVLMWRISGDDADFSAIEQAWSEPVFTYINYGQSGDPEKDPVLIFGAGFDADYDDEEYRAAAAGDSGAAVYIVDALSGAKRFEVSSDAGADLVAADMIFPITGHIASITRTSFSDVSDTFYFADLGGQVWKMSLYGDDHRIERIATFADSSGETEQRRFYYAPEVVPFNDGFARGINSNDVDFYYLLLVSGDRENPLDEIVRNQVIALKDRELYVSDFSAAERNFGFADLYDVTEDPYNNVEGADKSKLIQDLEDTEGWYFHLWNEDDAFEGEKGLSSGTVDDGIWQFNTYNPNAIIETSSDSTACTTQFVGGTQAYRISLVAGAGVNGDDDSRTNGDVSASYSGEIQDYIIGDGGGGTGPGDDDEDTTCLSNADATYTLFEESDCKTNYINSYWSKTLQE